jgi:hypothetical protein
MDILVEAHSGIRWLVLVGLAATVVVGFARSERELNEPWLRWVAIAFDIQVALGILLYLVNRGWAQGSFIAVVHPIGMIVALGIFHAGLSRGRRIGGKKGRRVVATTALASLAVVIAAIPW